MSVATAAVNSTALSKKYGATQALDNVRIQVEPGSFYGLLGPNGAGKSTLMKLMVGLLAPTGGSIDIFGRKAGKGDEVRRMVGYVPQDVAVYESLNARHNLQYFGSMYGLRGSELKKRIEEALEFVGLSEKGADTVKTYSGGMKRRLNAAAAILHKPKLLLLDEPTVGVDPQSRNRMFEMFKQLQQEGTTIVYSSHYMEEVEEMCDTVGIIDRGKLIEQDPLPDLLARYAGQEIYLEAASDTPMEEWLAGITPKLNSVKASGAGWRVEGSDKLELLGALAQSAKEHKVELRRLELVKPSLESVFLKLTGTSLRDE